MKFENKDQIKRVARETIDFYRMPEAEYEVCLEDYAGLIKEADTGDKNSIDRLLAYVRYCMKSGKQIDQSVAKWLENSLYLYLNRGVDFKKALGLSETGRPKNGGNLRDMYYWMKVEEHKFDGLSKLDAMILVQENRQNLADTLSKMGDRDHQRVDGIATIDQCHKRGWRLVKEYLEKTKR